MVGAEWVEVYRHYVVKAANSYRFDPAFIAAIIHIESTGDRFDTRYEPGYTHLWKTVQHAKKHGLSVATETQLQKMSWGLMQVMGGTARWLGFTGQIPELTEPMLNLDMGCMYLQKQRMRYGAEYSGEEYLLSVYNAGSIKFGKNGKFENQAYVDKVMAVLPYFRTVF